MRTLIDRPCQELRTKYGVNLRTGTEVTGVDLAAKEVLVGQERVAYETLVLATGGIPRRLPVPGKDLSNVFVLRDVEDAKKIDAGECRCECWRRAGCDVLRSSCASWETPRRHWVVFH